MILVAARILLGWNTLGGIERCGDALTGAAIMLAFGIGTLPAMLASSLFASRIASGLRRHATRQVVGALLLAFGVWLGWTAMPSARHLDHDHSTMVHSNGD